MSRQSEELERRSAARRADLRELCAEFQAAISALAADDLQALNASIDNQERLASKLQRLFQGERGPDGVSSIPKEALELIHVTRIYSALLQRSIRTASLRAMLCRTYKQHLAKSADSATTTSWSCEV